MNATMGAYNDDAVAVAVTPGDDPHGRCELLGPFALFVQGALGALALLVLLWKRSREHPQRPLRIWFMDVSKQVLGGVLVHMANLLLSMMSSGTFMTEPSSVMAQRFKRDENTGDGDEGGGHQNNPCSFYLLNLGIDTTIGVIILIYALRLLQKIVLSVPIPGFRTGITSGYYGDPPRWSYWMKQAAIYFTGLMIMKAIVGIMFALFPWLGMVGDFLLGWTEGNRRLQVFFVMFFFPLVMNAFQYYVIDSFIKHKDPSQTCLVDGDAPVEDSSDIDANYASDDGDLEEGSKGLLAPQKRISNISKQPSHGIEEYDPENDGEHRGSPESGYFRHTLGRNLRPGTVGSHRSRNSSMMLLPGSRGPSTPGYADEDMSVGGRSARTQARSTLGARSLDGGDDETLVGHDDNSR